VPRRVPAEAEAVLLGPELEHVGGNGHGHRPRPLIQPADDPVVPLASVKP
jgi:hypothetical protein